ncbi:MAG: hypothetical protein ACREFG_11760, partial [Chthoniobacterales bacterium]
MRAYCKSFALGAFLLLPVFPTHAAGGDSPPDLGDGKAGPSEKSKKIPMVQGASVAPPDTEFRIGIPTWVTGLSGDFGVRGVVANPDISFGDILNNLDMMAAGSIYARYHRWEFSADGLYLRVSKTAQLRGLLFGSAHVVLKDAFSEQFIGYRLIHRNDGFLSVFAGARYN